jgi:hypothetical protein
MQKGIFRGYAPFVLGGGCVFYKDVGAMPLKSHKIVLFCENIFLAA